MMYAQYTIVLKTLLDDPESKELIDKAMSTYPLFLPKNPSNHSIIPTREEINKKILDHYKYREIGFETFGRFLDELEISLNEIMPYYNQKFNSEDIINGLEDIFGNLDVIEEFEEKTRKETANDTSSDITSEGSESVEGSGQATSTGSDSSSTNSNINTSSKHVKSDTPSSQLSIGANDIDSIKYASEVRWNKDDSSNTATTEGSTNTETNSSNTQDTSTQNSSHTIIEQSGLDTGSTTHTLHRKGNQGVNTYAHDMLEFRGLFLNIIQEIINDPRIQELFMGVY